MPTVGLGVGRGADRGRWVGRACAPARWAAGLRCSHRADASAPAARWPDVAPDRCRDVCGPGPLAGSCASVSRAPASGARLCRSSRWLRRLRLWQRSGRLADTVRVSGAGVQVPQPTPAPPTFGWCSAQALAGVPVQAGGPALHQVGGVAVWHPESPTTSNPYCDTTSRLRCVGHAHCHHRIGLGERERYTQRYPHGRAVGAEVRGAVHRQLGVLTDHHER